MALDIFNLINFCRVMTIILLSISIYSVILKLISEYNQESIIRDLWILLTGIYVSFDYFFLKIIPPGNVFLLVNKIQIALVPFMLFLINKDFSKITFINLNKFYSYLLVLIIILTPIELFSNFIYYDKTSRLSVYPQYYFFLLTYIVIGLIPYLLFIVWIFKKTAVKKNYREVVFFILFYAIIFLAGIRDGSDISKPPIIIYALFTFLIFGIISNILKYKKITDKISYYSSYDDLTDVLKRKIGIEFIEKLIEKRRIHKNKFSIIFVEINSFKRINDVYSHNIGNLLLVEISNRLKSILKKTESLYRTEGDEFMVILDGVYDNEENSLILKDIFKKLEDPFKIINTILNISFSIGVSIFPDHGETASELLKNADDSVKHAAATKNKKVVVFNEKLKRQNLELFLIEEKLKETLKGDNNEKSFFLQYQPKVNADKKITGMEGLLRWKYNNEIIPPNRFINIAEKAGLINEIGCIVLELGCKEIKKLNEQNINIEISINLSPDQLNDPDLMGNIIKIIKKYNINPEFLEIELTESLLMTLGNEKNILEILNEIKKLGIKISIDDFGTGYSSFSRIVDLPINYIKIDRSFIMNLPSHQKSRMVCIAMINVAHELGLKTVAEGVEKKEQADFLFENKCDFIQGFYFYQPMNPEDINKLFF